MWIGYEKYKCDFCNNEENEENDTYSQIWECEECGKHFCRKCFINKYGEKTFFKMVSENDKIKCMDCYR